MEDIQDIKDIASDINAAFWTPKFWLPENTTWSDLQNQDDGPYSHIYYPQLGDLLIPFPIAAGLLLLRYLMERFIFRPIGSWFKLKNGTIIMPENIPTLHRYYKKVRKPTYAEMQKLSSELNWTTRQVERWFRKRRNLDKSSVLKKFCEGCWRWAFYLTVHIFGVFIMYDEDFVYNLDLAWDNWPHHHVKDEFYWYYIVELAFYWSLVFSLTKDVKRKDFKEQYFHHILTIFLMYFSWISNLVRIGVLVLCLHDMVDHWLEIAKLCKYLRFERTADVIFVIFSTVWIVTRLVVFPSTLVYKCWTKMHNRWPAYNLYLVMITALQLLHFFWTIPLLQAFYNAIVKCEVGDTRSASEEEALSDENENTPDHNDSKLLNGKLANGCTNGIIPHGKNKYH